MTSSPAKHSLLSPHTFGRDHRDPPPLPSSVQQGQAALAGQMGSTKAQAPQVYTASLPHDFDHIVRNVGEW